MLEVNLPRPGASTLFARFLKSTSNCFAESGRCCIILGMKNQHILTVILMLLLPTCLLQAESYRKWEFVNPAHLLITITPEKPEIVSGTVATFTITIRNRTDKTVKIHYPTGQQWDLATFHGRTQIYRWSQGFVWADAPHTIPLKSGETRSEQLTWLTVDRNNTPLPHGVYTAQGMVMTVPRHLVSNDCHIRLLPPEIKPTQLIETRLNQHFDIELPRFSGKHEIDWKIDYVYNDNRISIYSVNKTTDKTVVTFLPKRVGHVEFHLYAYHDTQDETKSIERRSFRIEVK
ncbi:MAG: hypothetical protein ACD_39C00105G0002 [uncultured bacterium]|nr:MAG: hypothetical protein ACD_39C00105G0002 [uncultured bacterium]